jgi:AraC-like DNA-binding protein
MILCLSPHTVDIDTEWETAHFILHKRETDCHCIAGGSLSIKMARDGRILHHIDHRLHALDDDGYLIVNERELYNVTKEAPHPVEAFSVYFESGFAEDAARSLDNSPQILVDNPFGDNNGVVQFFERIYSHNEIISPIMRRIRDAVIRQQVTWRWFEDQIFALMEGMLSHHQTMHRELDQLSAVRRSTREEIYRRLYHAYDFAVASMNQPITIKDMAHVALMSPSYFLRTFQELFHQTPYQFLQTKRLLHAEKLLRCSDASITNIAQNCGFERVSSFSWFFSQRFGLSPRQYRLQHRSG